MASRNQINCHKRVPCGCWSRNKDRGWPLCRHEEKFFVTKTGNRQTHLHSRRKALHPLRGGLLQPTADPLMGLTIPRLQPHLSWPMLFCVQELRRRRMSAAVWVKPINNQSVYPAVLSFWLPNQDKKVATEANLHGVCPLISPR